MISIRSQLTERIIVLTVNNNNTTNNLYFEKYRESYKTRAKIQQIGYTAEGKEIYNVEFPLSAAKLKTTPFAGILWNSKEYLFSSPLKITKNGFIFGTVKQVT